MAGHGRGDTRSRARRKNKIMVNLVNYLSIRMISMCNVFRVLSLMIITLKSTCTTTNILYRQLRKNYLFMNTETNFKI